MKLIDYYRHGEQGYNPFLITDRWQVALLNYAPAETLEAIDKLDVHHYTDEVFVLLRGRSALIAADIKNDLISYEVIDMQPNVVYNIPTNRWHKIAMMEESQVLIVENNNTHLGDFEFYHLNKKQKQELRDIVSKKIFNENTTL
jgi:mannose-6-phosphate isomerase-like protein (cupin superfamily)